MDLLTQFDNVIGNHMCGQATDADVVKMAYRIHNRLIRNAGCLEPKESAHQRSIKALGKYILENADAVREDLEKMKRESSSECTTESAIEWWIAYHEKNSQ